MSHIPKEKGIGQHIYTDEEIKKLLEQGLSHYKIAKYYHVSPKRITRISKGETAKSIGGQGKFTDEQIDFVKNLYHEHPDLNFIAIRDKFKQKFSITMSYGKISNIIGKSKGKLLSPENRKIDQPNAIYSFSEGKQYQGKIDFTKLIFNIDLGNINESGTGIQNAIAENEEYMHTLIELFSYFLLIRPTQRKILLPIFSTLFMKFPQLTHQTFSSFDNLKDYMKPDGFHLLSCLLVSQEVIPFSAFPNSHFQNLNADDINQNFLMIYQPDTIEFSVMNDDIDKIQSYIINTPSFDYTNPIYAKITNSSEIIRHEAMTLLDFSSYYGAEKAFKFFINNGSSYTDLVITNYSIFGGNSEIIDLLVQKGVSFNNTLKYCIQYHRYSLTKWVLDNFQCEDVPLFVCLAFYNLEAFLFLLHNSTKANKSNTLFSICTYKDSFDINLVEMLIKFGADVNKEKANKSLLYQVCTKENTTFKDQLIHMLINEGADVNKGTKHLTPLYALCKQKEPNMEHIQLLLSNGADINKGEKTPLYALCKSSEFINTMFLSFLLDNGADINQGDILPITALCYRSNLSIFNVIKTFIDKGSDLNKGSVLPLTAACESPNSELSIIQLLVQNGADVNKQSKSMVENDSITSPLIAACENEHCSLNIIEYLLQNGANPNQEKFINNDAVSTPITIILSKKQINISIIRLLINSGAKITHEQMEIVQSISLPKEVKDIIAPIVQNAV